MNTSKKNYFNIFLVFFSIMSNVHSQEVDNDTVITKEVFFNKAIEDSYRNLENINTQEVQEYAKQLNKEAEEHFNSSPDAFKYRMYLKRIDYGANEEIKEVKIAETGALFYRKLGKGDYSWKLYYRANISKEEKLLFNPEKYDGEQKGDYEITSFKPSWDGTKVAIGVATEYSHTSEIILLDTETGTIEKTGITNSRPGEYYGMNWTPSGTSFTYTSLLVTDPKNPAVKLNTSLSIYSLESKQSRIIFGNDIEPITDNRLFPITKINSIDDEYIVVYTAGPSNFWNSYYTTFKDLNNERPNWKRLLTDSDKAYKAFGKWNKSDFYIISEDSTSTFGVYSIDVKKRKKIKKKVFEIESDLIKDILLSDDKIYYTTSKYGVSSNLFVYENKSHKKIDLPIAATNITLRKNYKNSIWLDIKSALKEISHFSYDPKKGVTEEHIYEQGNYEMFEDFEYELIEVKSHDGELVPMSIISKKDIVLDGTNPVFSYSYGAFGSNDDVDFQTHTLSFVAQGGILVFPHIRGGGAKGAQWHEAGKKEKKHNSWLDLIACMEYLVDHKYTKHSKITLFSESAGAIATAMAVNKRPDLVGALIIGSGVLNPYRKEAIYKSTGFLEYGTMKDSTEAIGLIAMDPYLNVPKNAEFPSTLILHGEKDDRIYTHEPLKYISKMNENNIGTNPILLDLDPNGTHNSVTSFYTYFARVFTFAFSQTDSTPKF